MLADVLDGYVTAAQARSVYGVAIDEASGRVDEDETAALRRHATSRPQAGSAVTGEARPSRAGHGTEAAE